MDETIRLIEVAYTSLLTQLRSGDLAFMAATDHCDALRDRAQAIGVVIPGSAELSETIGELAEDLALADVQLQQGSDEYYAPMLQERLTEAIKTAEKLGIDVHHPRSVAHELAVDLLGSEIRRTLFDLDFGERPPQQEWRWDDYAGLVERGRLLGVDTAELEAALDRARHVERCGVDDDPEEDDDQASQPDAEDDAASQPDEEDDVVSQPDEDNDLASQLDAEDDLASQLDAPATITPAALVLVGRPMASPRAQIDAHLRRLARQSVGDGRATLRDIIWALLSLEESRCTRLEGPQLALVEHLVACNVLARRPCERAARAAIRDLLRRSPLVEVRSRTFWIYHLDQLRSPTPEFLALIQADTDADANSL